MAYDPRKLLKKETRPVGSKKTMNDPAGLSKFPTLTGSLDASGSQGANAFLAERDIRLGRATWNKYVLSYQDFGKLIFKELFQMYPDHERFFMHLIQTNNRDLFAIPQFKNVMVNRVTAKLKDIMESLDKPDELNEIMTKVGLYHAKLGVTRRNIMNMQVAIVNAVRIVMNKQMQADEEEALNKCLAYAFRIAINVGEEYYENQKQAAQPAQPAQ